LSDFELKLEMLPWALSMLIITSCVHEAGHAWAAWRLGDRNEEIRRRITPFTWRHISLPFTVILPAVMMLFAGMMLGGAKPVHVRLSIGPARMAVVALAGPIGNVFCGILSILVLVGFIHGGWLEPDIALGFDRTYMYALQAVMLNFILAALNLLPIPPFDGSRIVALFLPEKLRRIYYSFTIPSIILLLVAFFLLYSVYENEFMEVMRTVLLELHTIVLQVRDWVQ
jgi:Zn-dependent protease